MPVAYHANGTSVPGAGTRPEPAHGAFRYRRELAARRFQPRDSFPAWQCSLSLGHGPADGGLEGRKAMPWRKTRAMDFRTLATLAVMWLIIYSAWLTSIVFCSANDDRRLLIAAAAFFPIGVVHGIGVWFGGW